MNQERPTRVVLVDDQEPYRIGLRAVLSTLADVEVVGEAIDGFDAVTRCVACMPDVVLMDVRMPRCDGLAATRELSRIDRRIRVLVLTTFYDAAVVRSALDAGAVGYVLKDTVAGHLASLIRMTRYGYAAFSPGVTVPRPEATAVAGAGDDRERLARLTSRERDVLHAIGRGATNRDIAASLFLSEGTVKNHVTRILAELGLRSRTEAALLIRRFE